MRSEPSFNALRRSRLACEEIEEDRHMRESGNRSAGATAELSARLKRDQAGDEIVQDRVRSALGRVASQPDAIKVSVYVRRVILNGPVPAAELDSILRSVARVRGVREVENQLEVHEQTSGVSSLTRLLSGAVGTAAAIAGLRRRGSLGRLLTVFGLGMLARALLDRSIHGGRNQEQSDRTDWPLSATESTV
jgi:BON domain